jgi:hypothetical protein
MYCAVFQVYLRDVMADIVLKTSRKAADLHPVRLVTARKPEPSKRAQAQGGVVYDGNYATCCNCWAVNVVEFSATHYLSFQCWNCGWYCDV